jgi:hypothetical protein
MKSIVIFRFTRMEEPGYFATFLGTRSISWNPIRIDEGETLPDSAGPFSEICLVGGTVGVDDPLPWIERPDVPASGRSLAVYSLMCLFVGVHPFVRQG